MTGLLNDDLIVDTGTPTDGPVTAAGRSYPECTCKPPRWPQWNDAGERMEHSPDCLRWESEPESEGRRVPITGFRLDRPEIEGGPEPATRTDHQVQVSIANLLEESLAELKRLNARAGDTKEDRTSVKIETGAKREMKATVHVYAGDTDQAANTWLVEEAIRLHQLAQLYCELEAAKS